MSLIKNVFINEQFAQSINVERDESSLQRIEAYVPTAITKKSLESFINASKNNEFQKAWSFIGPYGSGKSFFAVFFYLIILVFFLLCKEVDVLVHFHALHK